MIGPMTRRRREVVAKVNLSTQPERHARIKGALIGDEERSTAGGKGLIRKGAPNSAVSTARDSEG